MVAHVLFVSLTARLTVHTQQLLQVMLLMWALSPLFFVPPSLPLPPLFIFFFPTSTSLCLSSFSPTSLPLTSLPLSLPSTLFPLSSLPFISLSPSVSSPPLPLFSLPSIAHSRWWQRLSFRSIFWIFQTSLEKKKALNAHLSYKHMDPAYSIVS